MSPDAGACTMPRGAHLCFCSPSACHCCLKWPKCLSVSHVLDLYDLQHGRAPMGKAAYKKRVQAVLRSKKAQAVAKAKFKAFRKVCLEVARKRGAASRS